MVFSSIPLLFTPSISIRQKFLISDTLSALNPDWYSKDAAKRIYRAFHQHPDGLKSEDRLKKLINEFGDEKMSQTEILERLLANADLEETLNEIENDNEVGWW
uniref:Uncharacterized protein n=1 Tax=Bursaphelenchus xylophilus TaxID=6326 RepID=A0A1I7SJ01_BURXY